MQQTKEEKIAQEYQSYQNQISVLEESKEQSDSFVKKDLSDLALRFNNLNSAARLLLLDSNIGSVPSLPLRDVFGPSRQPSQNKRYSLANLVKEKNNSTNSKDLNVLKPKPDEKLKISPAEEDLIKDINSKKQAPNKSFKPSFYEAKETPSTNTSLSEENQLDSKIELENKYRIPEQDVLYSVLKKANAEESKFIASQQEAKNTPEPASSKVQTQISEDKPKEDIWTYQPDQHLYQETFENEEISNLQSKKSKHKNRSGRSKFLVFSSLVLLASGVYWFNQHNKKQELPSTSNSTEALESSSSEDQILDSLDQEQPSSSSTDTDSTDNLNTSSSSTSSSSNTWYQPKAPVKNTTPRQKFRRAPKVSKQTKKLTLPQQKPVEETKLTKDPALNFQPEDFNKLSKETFAARSFPIAISPTETNSLQKFPSQDTQPKRSESPRDNLDYYQSPSSYQKIKSQESPASNLGKPVFSIEDLRLESTQNKQTGEDQALKLVNFEKLGQKDFDKLSFPLALTLPIKTEVESISSNSTTTTSFDHTEFSQEQPEQATGNQNPYGYNRVKNYLDLGKSKSRTKSSSGLYRNRALKESPYQEEEKEPVVIRRRQISSNGPRVIDLKRLDSNSSPVVIAKSNSDRASRLRAQISQAEKRQKSLESQDIAYLDNNPYSLQNKKSELSSIERDLAKLEKESFNKKKLTQREKENISSEINSLRRRVLEAQENLENSSNLLEGEASQVYSGN